MSGQNIAEYTIKKNSIAIERKRTYFGGNLNAEVDFVGAGYTVNVQLIGIKA